ncbi:surface glycoprotein [Halobaculum sp. MBLA0147]|uniref:DUF7827 domain-containing protein n=1 Tax=Halobaculum sp. MBLA0147 TaxID=3079934 RepID=UPI003525C420
MTDTNEKVRALFLSALMVFSVFAGTVAFSGAAAAANTNATVEGAIEFGADGSSGDGDIEIAFNQSNSISNSDIGTDLNVTLNGNNVNDDYTVKTSGARTVLEYDDDNGTITPGDTLEIEYFGETTEVTTTANTLVADGSSSARVNAYEGAVVAVDFSGVSGASTDFAYERYYDGEFQFGGSTGANSFLVTLDTEGQPTAEIHEFRDSTGVNTLGNLSLRSLGLSASLDSTEVVRGEDEITVDVSANQGNRPVTLTVEDPNGDEFDSTTQDLNNNGQTTFTVPVSASDDTGNYSITVTDDNTGVEATTGDAVVVEQPDSSASFEESVTVPRGDIVEFTVNLENTDTARVQVGSDSKGYNVSLRVNDGTDDDESVTIRWNTYNSANSTSADGNLEAFSVVTENTDTQDNINFTASSVDNDVDNVIAPTNYQLRVFPGEDADNPSAFSSVTVTERSLGSIQMWTAPKTVTPSDLTSDAIYTSIDDGAITQDQSIAANDLLVHQIRDTTGLEGLIDLQNGSSTNAKFLDAVGDELALTIEQDSPAPNDDPLSITPTPNNAYVVGDTANDTYFIIVDTGALQNSEVNNGDVSDVVNAGDFTTTLTVDASNVSAGYFDGTDAEFDESINQSFEVVSTDVEITQANASQSETGTVVAETNVAPGSTFRVEVSSVEETTDGFIESKEVTVQRDGTVSAEFAIFADRTVGEEYNIVFEPSAGGEPSASATGFLQEADATPTATPTTMGNMTSTETETDTPEPTDTETDTPEPTDTETDTPEPTDTETDTPEPTETDEPTETEESTETEETTTSTGTPGFTAVVGVVALLGAALVALRRRN